MACIAHVIKIMIKMAATPYVSSQGIADIDFKHIITSERI